MPKINILGLAAIIPITMFLTISFFVLLGAEKTECANLKKFGKFVAVMLWICSAFICALGIYVLITGSHPALPLMEYLFSLS
ncbi:MAG: hypothetical protein KKD35_06485 [Elusimicrobia bacterium]|nr:hypothetical protein [Elusimicrobiota bacterium]